MTDCRHRSSTRRRPLLGNRLLTMSPFCLQSARPLTHRRDQWGLQALVQSEEVLDALTLRREAWVAIETVDGAIQRVMCFSGRCCANRNWPRALPTRRFVTDRSRTTLVDQARSFD